MGSWTPPPASSKTSSALATRSSGATTASIRCYREVIGRAGGFVCVNAIIDPTAGFIENLVGYGTKLVERHDRQYQLLPGETITDISNSGKNSAPLEVA